MLDEPQVEEEETDVERQLAEMEAKSARLAREAEQAKLEVAKAS